MNVKDVEKIVKLMDEHGLTEIEIEDGNGKVRIKKQGDKESIKEIISIPQMQAAPAAAPAAAAAPGVPAPAAEAPVGPSIQSPLVGTFYRRANPDSDPFVKVGDHVSEDTVVCIVEAMKVMNEIKAEVSGTIKKVLVDDAHPVEYMQPLFAIEPD